MVMKARRDGIAVDMEEYIEGIRGLAAPLNISTADTQAAIWAVGLRRQINAEDIPRYCRYLKEIVSEFERRVV
jgi:DNA-binding IclR family transcriptional regulator